MGGEWGASLPGLLYLGSAAKAGPIPPSHCLALYEREEEPWEEGNLLQEQAGSEQPPLHSRAPELARMDGELVGRLHVQEEAVHAPELARSTGP